MTVAGCAVTPVPPSVAVPRPRRFGESGMWSLRVHAGDLPGVVGRVGNPDSRVLGGKGAPDRSPRDAADARGAIPEPQTLFGSTNSAHRRTVALSSGLSSRTSPGHVEAHNPPNGLSRHARQHPPDF